jgi:hypothetical protein
MNVLALDQLNLDLAMERQEIRSLKDCQELEFKLKTQQNQED